MALSHVSLEENLRCSICLEIFNDPVLLTCSHSFCRTCVERTWVHKEIKECPMCRKMTKYQFVNNVALRETCESFKQERKRKIEPQSLVCLLHTEKLELFCMDDKQLVCLKCVKQDHQNHNFCSISKAAKKQKIELDAPLQALHSKLKTIETQKSTNSNMLIKFQSQVRQTEEQIKEQFKELHQFLRQEQEARIAALRKEEEKETRRMKAKAAEMDKQLTSVSELINKVNNDMSSDDSSFLHNLRSTEERVRYTVPDKKEDPGALIDVVQHMGNLKYSVWEKMKDICPYYPIILDPATSHSKVQVSQYLNSITCELRQTGTMSPTNCKELPFILGSEGFTSGSHTWEVEVGPSDQWAVGVIKESDKTKPNPFSNALLIYMLKGKCSWNVRAEKINKVCVCLDSEKRRVEFTDAASKTTLKTYTYKYSEKIYPWFCNFSSEPLSILPAKVSVSI